MTSKLTFFVIIHVAVDRCDGPIQRSYRQIRNRPATAHWRNGVTQATKRRLDCGKVPEYELSRTIYQSAQ